MFGSPDQKMQSLALKARAEREVAISETQLEFWPDSKHAIPNALIRCTLFGATLAEAGGKRTINRETHVASLAGYQVYYSGEVLDQKDMDTWMAIIQLFRSSVVHNTIEVSGYQLLNMLGLAHTGLNQKALQERIKRLAFSRLDIVPDDPARFSTFHGALIQHAERGPGGKMWSIRLASQLRALFSDGYTRIDREIRSDLRSAPLAQWLHAFYRSHLDPYPISVETLHELYGSQPKEMRFFRSNLFRWNGKNEDAHKQLKTLTRVC